MFGTNGLALSFGCLRKVQFSCEELTPGPAGSLAGRGSAAHTIEMTAGIPAIPNVVLVSESSCLLELGRSLPVFVKGGYSAGKRGLSRAAVSCACAKQGSVWILLACLDPLESSARVCVILSPGLTLRVILCWC